MLICSSPAPAPRRAPAELRRRGAPATLYIGHGIRPYSESVRDEVNRSTPPHNHENPTPSQTPNRRWSALRPRALHLGTPRSKQQLAAAISTASRDIAASARIAACSWDLTQHMPPTATLPQKIVRAPLAASKLRQYENETASDRRSLLSLECRGKSHSPRHFSTLRLNRYHKTGEQIFWPGDRQTIAVSRAQDPA